MMLYSTDLKSAAVRARLDHPVIDGDGHWLEPVPIFLDYLREVAEPSVVEGFRKMATAHIDRGWYDMTPAERLDRRPTRPTTCGGRCRRSPARRPTRRRCATSSTRSRTRAPTTTIRSGPSASS